MQCAEGHGPVEMILVERRPDYTRAEAVVELWTCTTCGKQISVSTPRSFPAPFSVRGVQEVTPSREAQQRAIEEEKRKAEEELAAARRRDREFELLLGETEEVEIPLDERRVINWECQVCGNRGVHPLSVASLWRRRDRDTLTFVWGACQIAVKCDQCGKRSVSRSIGFAEAATATGSPVLKRMSAEIEEARKEAESQRAEREQKELTERRSQEARENARIREQADKNRRASRRSFCWACALGLPLALLVFLWTLQADDIRWNVLGLVLMWAGGFAFWFVAVDMPHDNIFDYQRALQEETDIQEVSEVLREARKWILSTVLVGGLLLPFLIVLPIYLRWQYLHGLQAQIAVASAALLIASCVYYSLFNLAELLDLPFVEL